MGLAFGLACLLRLDTLTAFGGLLGRPGGRPGGFGAQPQPPPSGPERWQGAAGVMAVREIRSRGEQGMELRGFVDDDPLKQGAVISGLKVPGSSEALPTLVPALGIDQVIVTIADALQARLRRILSICEGIPVRAQMIPAM